MGHGDSQFANDVDPGSDELTLARARSGDRHALGELISKHRDYVFNLALRVTSNRNLAEEVLQDTSETVIRKLRDFRGSGPLRAWIRVITVRSALDRMKAEDRWRALETAPEPTTQGMGDTSWDAETLLARLDPIARTVLWLHAVEGCTHAEIARHTGCSESHSKMTLKRTLHRLRDDMDEGADPTRAGERPCISTSNG